jgi:hypothetical protein
LFSLPIGRVRTHLNALHEIGLATAAKEANSTRVTSNRSASSVRNAIASNVGSISGLSFQLKSPHAKALVSLVNLSFLETPSLKTALFKQVLPESYRLMDQETLA